MSKAVRITPEQYLALLDLGVPVLCSYTIAEESRCYGPLLRNEQSEWPIENRKRWADARYRDLYNYWTLVDG